MSPKKQREYQVEFGEGIATMIAPEMTAIAPVSVGISLFPLPLWAWYNN